MRRLGLRASRWHQHGVHGSRPNVPSAPLSRRRFTCGRQLAADNDERPDVKVRWWVQPTFKSKQRVEVDPDAEDLEEEEAVLAKIREVRARIAERQEGLFKPGSPLMKELTEKEREILQEAVRQYETEYAEEIEKDKAEDERLDKQLEKMLRGEVERYTKEQEEESDPFAKTQRPPVIPKESFEIDAEVPSAYDPYINRFNKSLKPLRKEPNRLQKLEAWRSYRRCKEYIPSFINMIPDDGLSMLWDSEVQNFLSGGSQQDHWEILADDILSVGRSLTESQWLEYVELLYKAGKIDKAFPLWKARRKVAKDYSPEDVERYWQLGVQLRIAQGNVNAAEDTAVSFLAEDKARHPRILIPVMIAWAALPGTVNGSRAWALYLQLKARLKRDITMEDYDAISVGLLKASRVDMALAVFKDMMLTGQNSSSESTAVYKASLGLVGNLQASSITVSDVNKVSLSAFTMLPRKFQNKFFYASWLKKLIGMGEVDSAVSVVELMYERGVNPDPKHMNGIIGAWLREGSPSAKEKAEKMAWAMIQERIDQVQARSKAASSDQTSNISTDGAQRGLRIPRFVKRKLPAASIETFSLLLLHYSRRSQDNMANYLIECLEKSQFKPNAFFMNHLLYAELRRQDIQAVWTRYLDMTSTVKPDLETFACLWDCGKHQYDKSRRPVQTDFPSARGLYAEMLRWFSSLNEHGQKVARSDFSNELYGQIVRCFCLSVDPQGTLVALCSLRKLFTFAPDSDTIRSLMFQIVRLAPTAPGVTKPRRRRLSSIPKSRENVEQVAKLVEMLRDRKFSELMSDGVDVRSLDDETQKDLQVELMCDLLRVVLGRIYQDHEKTEDMIRAAATQMGVGDVDLGKPLNEFL